MDQNGTNQISLDEAIARVNEMLAKNNAEYQALNEQLAKNQEARQSLLGKLEDLKAQAEQRDLLILKEIIDKRGLSVRELINRLSPEA